MRKVRSKAAADRIGHAREHDGNCTRLAGKHADRGCALTEDRVGPQIDQLFCERSDLIRISGAPAKFDPEITAFRPPQLRERSPECCEPRLHSRVVLRKADQNADAPQSVGLLRTRDKRPCNRRATKERNELAPLHSITSSARPDSGNGTVMPSAFAVLRLMTSSTFVTCCTGRSAGLSPLRMRPV